MLRLISVISASTILRSLALPIVAASVLTASAARAHGTYQECLNEAGAQYARDIQSGVPRDVAAIWWKDAIDACGVVYHR